MYLVTAATDFEMASFAGAFGESNEVKRLVTGVGPVETAVRLTSWLAANQGLVHCVLNIGVAGAYKEVSGQPGAEMLSVCLAEREVLGDLGICFYDRIEHLDGIATTENGFLMDPAFLGLACRTLARLEQPFYTGTFVTVSCVSGTARRGQVIAQEYNGLCENMEGAAVARVCKQFDIPCLELRCISNLVEDRDKSKWQLKAAAKRAGHLAATLVREFVEKQATVEV